MTHVAPPLDTMLDQLIACPSVSSVNAELDTGNREVSECLAGWLEALGFRVSLSAVSGDANKCNVVGVLGEGDAGLVLAGHTDTVPFDEGRWSSDPFTATRRDGRLYGLGAADMKGFFALVIEALRDVAPGRLRRPLVVLATADEESGMAGARQLADAGKPLGRFALIGEPTGLRPVRAHKGILMLRIVLIGRSGHSSDPALGISALDGMHEVIRGLVDLRARLASGYGDSRFAIPAPTLNLGRIAGGDNPNRICARCELDIDLRLTPGITLADARRLLKQCVHDATAGRGLEVEFKSLFDGVEAMDTPAESALVRKCESLTGCKAGLVSFATEAPFLDKLGMQTVVMGPGDIAVAHQPDEFLDLARMAPMTAYLRQLVHEFCETD